MRYLTRVREIATGRTGIVSDTGDSRAWVIWDDAASYPRSVSLRYLTSVGQATSADEFVCFAPGQPQHGKKRGAALAQGLLPA